MSARDMFNKLLNFSVGRKAKLTASFANTDKVVSDFRSINRYSNAFLNDLKEGLQRSTYEQGAESQTFKD